MHACMLHCIVGNGHTLHWIIGNGHQYPKTTSKILPQAPLNVSYSSLREVEL